MDTLLQDIRYAVRTWLKNPGLAIVAVTALAIGIGANTAIFSVLNAVLLRSLPYQDPGRITMLWGKNPHLQLSMVDFPISYGDFIDLRDRSQVFESLSALYPNSVNLTGSVEPEHVGGVDVSANLFQTIGIAPVLGRSFLPEDERPGAERVVIVSHGLWRRHFGSDPNIIGKAIQLNGESCTVIGLLPSHFEFPQRHDLLLSYGFPRQVEIWRPLTAASEELQRRGNHVLIVMGRLQTGITVEQAQSETEAVAATIARQYPETRSSGWTVALVPLHEQLVGSIRPALILLWGAVGFVLLIACANVANLLLARAASRQKEIALRQALGAGALRIVRQLLTESVMLSVAGGAAGLLLALWCTDILLALSPTSIPRIGKIGLDGRVLSFTLLLSLLTGIVFGLVPAWQSAKPDLSEALKEGGKGATGSRHRARSLFVISEIALTFVLLIGAGLMVRSFLQVQKVDLGFDPRNVLAMQINLPQSKYPEPRQRTEFFNQLTEKVGSLPGVKSVGLTWQVPLGGSDAGTSFVIEGRAAEREEAPLASIRRVDSGYFRTIATPIQEGRDFTRADRERAVSPVIINETMARQFWPGQSPIGKRIRVHGVSREIIGVAKDVRYSALDSEPTAEMYLQSNLLSMNLLVRADSVPLELVAAIRGEVASIDQDQPISDVTTLEQRVSTSVAVRRFNMLLLTLFAVVALSLAVVGIYAVVSYSVTQSTREIGIRVALGATRRDVFALVIGHGMVLTVAGISLGLAAALALTRLMTTLLFSVSATDAITFVSVSLVLAGVALAACFVPAWRATEVDPMIALRYE